MTPLQKANELFDKYMAFEFNTIVNRTQRQYAKKCALILVNEIIDLNDFSAEGRCYWNEVKTLLQSF